MHGLLTSVLEQKDNVLHTFICGHWGEECQLYGCGVSQICPAQCTKPYPKLNNDQSENDKSGG